MWQALKPKPTLGWNMSFFLLLDWCRGITLSGLPGLQPWTGNTVGDPGSQAFRASEQDWDFQSALGRQLASVLAWASFYHSSSVLPIGNVCLVNSNKALIWFKAVSVKCSSLLLNDKNWDMEYLNVKLTTPPYSLLLNLEANIYLITGNQQRGLYSRDKREMQSSHSLGARRGETRVNPFKFIAAQEAGTKVVLRK